MDTAGESTQWLMVTLVEGLGLNPVGSRSCRPPEFLALPGRPWPPPPAFYVAPPPLQELLCVYFSPQ
jgi:hypothetical protein